MSFDLQRARQETPGCNNVLHFNNAGAALMPQPVLDATIEHLQLEATIGGYEAAAQAQAKVERVYEAAATLIQCHPAEIAIIENATRAWDMAFYSLKFGPGDRILTAVAEYASNYIALLQMAHQTGAMIETIPNDEQGQLSVEALRNMLDERVKLIAITHVPTNGGLVNPAAAVGAIAREAGVFYLLDACQALGQLPIDVNAIGCDFLSATGRKYLRGPRGTGLLYVRRDLIEQLEPPFLDLHAAEWVASERYELRPDARRFENWETNYAGKIGLGVAIDYALAWGLDNTWQRIATLAESLRAQLTELPGVTVQDLGQERCGIVTFTAASLSPEAIKQALTAYNINVSVSPLVYTRLDMQARGLNNLVRASVHYYNSEAEVQQFCETLAEIL
ncbi:aminotransferase class V-fold PLP-dependent enzyme [Leptolyngbya sp. FACHB-261]|uniref:aminotransferase class V-fold PLP-dependent enzyme n=1 Tax=Leptolyngbya sp. FACHB-261 TaxID=2692806 RepID=UPI0016890DFC|nr:aminotransferase class V-fold PLP-dependent enzyme [Leptolyngbya sp. FACHB-261]MBD2101391.1 aminotransferase class V-fold PLP-dependent enzyme [Leptolyngbya sp. FACHB-261]